MVSRLFLASLLLPPLWQSCWLAVEKRWGARGSSWMGAWKYFTESILNLSLGWTWKQWQTSMGGSPTWQDCRLEATIPWAHGWVAQHNQGVLAKILVIPDKNNIYQSHFASHPTCSRVAHKHIAILYRIRGFFRCFLRKFWNTAFKLFSSNVLHRMCPRGQYKLPQSKKTSIHHV